jgi:hypothetical protein
VIVKHAINVVTASEASVKCTLLLIKEQLDVINTVDVTSLFQKKSLKNTEFKYRHITLRKKTQFLSEQMSWKNI